MYVSDADLTHKCDGATYFVMRHLKHVQICIGITGTIP